MKDFARIFYNGSQWRETQAAYMASQHYVCERCGSAARIVHHIRYLTPENITNLEVALGWDNLEALCIDCHNHEHLGDTLGMMGTAFDGSGNLVQRSNVFLVCGPLDSAKQEWIRKHKGKQDIVFSVEAIAEALTGQKQVTKASEKIVEDIRNLFFKTVQARKGSWQKAFIITETADKTAQKMQAEQLNAELILVCRTLEECEAAINATDNSEAEKEEQLQASRLWLLRQNGN